MPRVLRDNEITRATPRRSPLISVTGAAAMVEFKVDYPGNFVLVDHTLARVDRGAWGALHVEGEADPTIYDGLIESRHGH